MKNRKTVVASLVLLAAALAGAYALRAPIAVAIAMKVAVAKLPANAALELPDGLHVGLCGAGSPFPDERRSGPCTLVIAGKRQFVFDAGSGASRTIGKMGFNQGQVEGIFLTHFHSDHIDGLGELMLQRWVSTSNRAPVPVYGPPGVETVLAGFLQAYQQDQQYRVAHHGDATVAASGFGGVARPFALRPDQHTVVFKDDQTEIVAFEVDHSPIHPAVGYRIRYKDRSVVLSGDTVKSAAVQREAQGVDLLVHEALSVPLVLALKAAAGEAGRPNLQKIFNDILNYHTTPEQAAETARDAKVGYLLLNHIVPTLPPIPGMEAAFLGDAKAIYAGPIRVGMDGDFVSLSAGDKQIRVSRRF
jgi:ribonuclease Z